MNKATWIPGANGYVSNGQLVSQTPIYDSKGELLIDVSMEQVNNSSTTNQTANANKVQYQTGATVSETATANKPNTNMQTAIGSLGTTNNNTATAGTAVSSPATSSPQTNAQAQDPVQKYITDYSTALANQDLNGQINALMELDKYTVSQGGVPQYSEVIGNLQKQNTQQVTNTVNEYALQIAEATRTGNTALANGLQQELASFKQDNDYASVLENRKAEIETEYSFAYMQGINDITNGILSLLGKYSNFQYDPYSDPALQMAQGYATSAVKEQMNSTGMYYSSITQSAITRAINELIPVYEQMAKDEILQNISLLQSTASYLLNLEQAQFDMWASQIEMQILKNQEKRAEIEHAWDRVNNLGYVDNEASLILGVDVGTLSPEIRKLMLNEEMAIRAEERALKIEKELAGYSHSLALEKLEKENTLNKELALFKTGLSTTSSTVDPVTGVVDYAKEPNGTLNLSQLLDTAKSLKEQGINTSDILAEIYSNAKDKSTAYGAISSATLNDEYIFDNEFIREYGLEAYANLLEIQEGSKTPEELLSNSSTAVVKIKTMQTEGKITEDEANAMIQKYGEDSVIKVIDENSTKYGGNVGITNEALTSSINAIGTYSSALYETGSTVAKDMTVAMYKYLFDTIANANDDFDSHWAPNQGKWAKDIAIFQTIEKLEESKYYGSDTQKIVSELTIYKNSLKTKKLIG